MLTAVVHLQKDIRARTQAQSLLRLHQPGARALEMGGVAGKVCVVVVGQWGLPGRPNGLRELTAPQHSAVNRRILVSLHDAAPGHHSHVGREKLV